MPGTSKIEGSTTDQEITKDLTQESEERAELSGAGTSMPHQKIGYTRSGEGVKCGISSSKFLVGRNGKVAAWDRKHHCEQFAEPQGALNQVGNQG